MSLNKEIFEFVQLVLGIEAGKEQILSMNYLEFLDMMENYKNEKEIKMDFTISVE